ncbi:MAG: hypothetical protein Q9N02_06835 [Ghiorsea sp.]|nr:hypothetical protein [Ghiorsea sp.]
MIKHPIWLSMLVLCMLSGVASKANAELVPRIAYVIPATNGNKAQPSYMGKYWYLGAGFFNTSGGGLIGPSIRYGFGKTGKKLNISYLAGGKGLSLEGGISYVKQDANATLQIDSTLKGFAFEAALRYGITNFIFITSGSNSSFELGLGF